MSLTGKINGKTVRGKINRLYELRGYSAYEVAVLNGFAGTEEEWLESLKGKSANESMVSRLPSIFANVACIGDGYTSGRITNTPDGYSQVTKYKSDFGWVNIMATMTGRKWVNYGDTSTAVAWFEDSDPYLDYTAAVDENGERYDAHFIGFGVCEADDNYEVNDLKYPLMDVVSHCFGINEGSHIFLLTIPEEGYEAYNEAIRSVPDEIMEYTGEAFSFDGYVHVLDLYAYKDMYADLPRDKDGYPTRWGYVKCAENLYYILTEYMKAHQETFDGVLLAK